MLRADKTITVRNLVADTAADTERAVTTVLPGCSWYEQRAASAGTGGLTAATVVKVRIPARLTAAYVLPEKYTGTGWTLRPGDTLQYGDRKVTVLLVRDSRDSVHPHIYVEAS